MISAKHTLLCPPVYFDIEYSINPWMHIEEKVNRSDVLNEYRHLKKLYDKLNVPYDELTPTNGLPDPKAEWHPDHFEDQNYQSNPLA